MALSGCHIKNLKIYQNQKFDLPKFLVADKHYTIVGKSSLSFNHSENLQKQHYRRRIEEKTEDVGTVHKVLALFTRCST